MAIYKLIADARKILQEIQNELKGVHGMNQCFDCKTFKKADNCIQCKVQAEAKLQQAEAKLQQLESDVKKIMSTTGMNSIHEALENYFKSKK